MDGWMVGPEIQKRLADQGPCYIVIINGIVVSVLFWGFIFLMMYAITPENEQTAEEPSTQVVRPSADPL